MTSIKYRIRRVQNCGKAGFWRDLVWNWREKSFLLFKPICPPFFSTCPRRFFIFNVPLWSTLCFRHAWIVLDENLTRRTAIQKCFLTVWKTHTYPSSEKAHEQEGKYHREALLQRKIHDHMCKHYHRLNAQWVTFKGIYWSEIDF